MKKHSLYFLMALLLSGCAPATIAPTTTATITATSSPTITPTFTPTSTSTPRPTMTATPTLPETVQIEINSTLPENINDLVETAVKEAYWFYVNLGCSPNGFKVKITTQESGEVIAIDAFKVGWEDLNTDPSVMSTRISHETAHIMCQFAFTKHLNMGAIDLHWLTEGVANYFSAMEQINDTGMNSGVRVSSIKEHDRGMAQWVSENFCQIPISKLEPANAQDLFPNGVYAIADVATRLLVKTTPDGIKAVITYYTLLATTSKEEAFKQAFGRTKEEYYQQYQDECSKGFPTVIK